MSLFKSVLLILILSFAQLPSGMSEGEEFSFSSAWETFWSVSCEFTDLLENEGSSRNKRSFHQEPNFEDPLELFNYLYPLADMKPEDYMASEEQRSANSYLSTWIQDLIHLWGSECHFRASGREKRHAGKKSKILSFNQLTFSWTITSFGNLWILCVADKNGPTKYDQADEIIEEEEDGHNPYRYEHAANINSDDSLKNSSAPTTKEAPSPKKEKKTIADTDTFFAQYGGDIEYFFPLISFGIPFDGEITFLGFHGFKGLFPYK